MLIAGGIQIDLTGLFLIPAYSCMCCCSTIRSTAIILKIQDFFQQNCNSSFCLLKNGEMKPPKVFALVSMILFISRLYYSLAGAITFDIYGFLQQAHKSRAGKTNRADVRMEPAINSKPANCRYSGPRPF